MEMTTHTLSAGSGERYASLAYERLVTSFREESGSGSAAARAVHETAKRMMIIVQLERRILGWGYRQRPALLGGKMRQLQSLSIFMAIL